jgi:hypothetical protein
MINEYGAFDGMRTCRGNEVLGGNTPHILSHGKTGDGARASAVENTGAIVSPRNIHTRVLMTSVSQSPGRGRIKNNLQGRALTNVQNNYSTPVGFNLG